MSDSDENSPVKELSSAQRKAIPHLLMSRSIEEGAKAAGVSERTLYRWLRDRTFSTALVHAEGEAIDSATRRLAALADKAVDTLEAVLDNEDATPATKIRAALGVLESLLKLREMRSIELRLMALEAAYLDSARKP